MTGAAATAGRGRRARALAEAEARGVAGSGGSEVDEEAARAPTPLEETARAARARGGEGERTAPPRLARGEGARGAKRTRSAAAGGSGGGGAPRRRAAKRTRRADSDDDSFIVDEGEEAAAGGGAGPMDRASEGGSGEGESGGWDAVLGVDVAGDMAPEYAMDTSIRQTGRAARAPADGDRSDGDGAMRFREGGGSDAGGGGGGSAAGSGGRGGVVPRDRPRRPPFDDVWGCGGACGRADAAPWEEEAAAPLRGGKLCLFGVRVLWGDAWSSELVVDVGGGLMAAYARTVVDARAAGPGTGTSDWKRDLWLLERGVIEANSVVTATSALSLAAELLRAWRGWNVADLRGADGATALACRLACTALSWVRSSRCDIGDGAAAARTVDVSWSSAALSLCAAVMKRLCSCAADVPSTAAVPDGRGGVSVLQRYVTAVWLWLCRALRTERLRNAAQGVVHPLMLLGYEVGTWPRAAPANVQPRCTPHAFHERGSVADADEIAWELAARVTALARVENDGTCS